MNIIQILNVNNRWAPHMMMVVQNHDICIPYIHGKGRILLSMDIIYLYKNGYGGNIGYG